MDTRPQPNGISLSGWGATLKASGRDVVLFLLILALGVVVYHGFERLDMRMVQSDMAGLVEMRARMSEHQAILMAQNDLACVLAMPQEDRPAALLDPKGICHYVTTVYLYRVKR